MKISPSAVKTISAVGALLSGIGAIIGYTLDDKLRKIEIAEEVAKVIKNLNK